MPHPRHEIVRISSAENARARVTEVASVVAPDAATAWKIRMEGFGYVLAKADFEANCPERVCVERGMCLCRKEALQYILVRKRRESTSGR